MNRQRRSWPLFLRIFAVLLASVVVVQLASYALLIAAGPPAAEFRTVDEIAAALQRGGDQQAGVRVAVAATAPSGGELTPFARALATRLGVSPNRVLLARDEYRRGPPMPFMGPLHGRPPHDARSEVLFGRFVVAIRQKDGRWLTARSTRNEWGTWRRAAIIWFVTAALALTPFALLFSRWLARPIALFAAAAERLGRDPHAPMLAVEGPREIKEAAETFNEMQRRLARYLEDRTMLIGAIAHDLRTPLMRLALRLDDAAPDLRRSAEADIAEMQAMIVAATSFVRDATRPIERRPLELRALIESVTDELSDHGQAVSLDPGNLMPFDGNPVALKAMISNLVSNAVKYAGDAEMNLSEEGRNAVIEVRDHGPGIATEDLAQVFEPFFRGERSRNRDTGGLGLGLASARAVARAHGGDITIANHPDGGAVARVVMPI